MKVTARVGYTGSKTIEIELTLDADAFHTVLPESLALRAGISPIMTGLARYDGPVENMGLALVRVLDREGAVPVVLRPQAEPVLGFSTLQCLGLRVNETTGMLEHDRAFGPTMLGVRNG